MLKLATFFTSFTQCALALNVEAPRAGDDATWRDVDDEAPPKILIVGQRDDHSEDFKDVFKALTETSPALREAIQPQFCVSTIECDFGSGN